MVISIHICTLVYPCLCISGILPACEYHNLKNIPIANEHKEALVLSRVVIFLAHLMQLV